MQPVERGHCVFTGASDLRPVHVLARFPVHVGCTDEPPEEDVFLDQRLWLSPSSGSIQVNPLVPLEMLYARGHNSGTIGQLWLEHHRAFALFLVQHGLRRVLEIGAGHHTLARRYLELQPDAVWTSIGPNQLPSDDPRVRVVDGFFDAGFQPGDAYDAVVHSHVLEHAYEPREFVALVTRALSPDGWHCFAVPNMESMLEHAFTNVLNFEHSYYLCEPYIEYLIGGAGFRIETRQRFRDHAVFYASRRAPDRARGVLPSQLAQRHEALLQNYTATNVRDATALRAKMQAADAPVYLFGAHANSQYLIGFGLGVDGLSGVLDNDREKQGRRLYGTPLIAQSPRVLSRMDKAYVILRAGAYDEEIRRDILENINPNVVFW